jgi:hypothetical protein
VARWHEAEIGDRKILDCLLATDHPIGADKAAFFTSVGYSSEEWTRLRDDLMLMCEQGGEVVAEEQTPFGIKYVVDGLVQAPAGRNIELRTVWISEEPGDRPRLVTAYPR